MMLVNALADLTRPHCWFHKGPDYGVKPTRKPWWSRMTWKPFPWIGGDEWCRWTLVLPFPYYSLVIPLWGCRDPQCEACQYECFARSHRHGR